MKPQNVTIDEVMEIFSDYLKHTNDFEIVKTEKMGLLTVLDASDSKDRSLLSIEPVLNVDDLVQTLLWQEISEIYYSIDHGKKDPCDCDEPVETYVWNRMQPRLKMLPEKWADVLEEFFSDPDQ